MCGRAEGKQRMSGCGQSTPPPLAGGGRGQGRAAQYNHPLPPSPSRKGRGGLLMNFCLTLLGCLATASAQAERPVHRFLSIAVSPDGTRIASIEGDSPPSGYFPMIQTLVIRSADGQTATTVAFPCGQVAECWPASPAW